MAGQVAYAPDFIERNGTWVLSVLAVMSTCIGGLLAYFLKSRCQTVKCCGVECQRDVVDLRCIRDPNAVCVEMVGDRSAVPPV